MAKLPPFVPIARKAFRPLDKGGDVFWNEPRVFSRWEAWEDLIQQAARKPRRRLIERPRRPPVEVNLKAGELFGSVRFFAERWRWSKRRVEGFFSQLTGELNRLCTRHVTPAGTVYALVNFELYNIGGTADVVGAGHERDSKGTARGQNKRSNREKTTNTSETSSDVRVVFDYWVQKTGRTASTRLTPERRNKIKARLQTYSVDDLKQAINGVMASDWHRNNPNYTDLVSCFGNDTKVEQHIQRAGGARTASGSLNRPLSIDEARAMYG